jgi:hypothetical protein
MTNFRMALLGVEGDDVSEFPPKGVSGRLAAADR